MLGWAGILDNPRGEAEESPVHKEYPTMAAQEQPAHDRLVAQPNDRTESRARDPVRILLVEDVPTEAEITIRQVRKGGIACTWHRVETESALRDALRDFQPNIILSDFSLPQFTGLGALGVAREVAPDLPFIFVSGTIGEERAIEALRCGAMDYVIKGNLNRLTPAITRALHEAAARIERRRQEAKIVRLTRVLRLLSGVNAAVARIHDQRELFAEACRLAVTVGGYATALVALPHPETHVVQPVACSGVNPEATESLRAAVTAAVSRKNSVISGVLKSGISFVCNDTIDDPTATVNIDEMMTHAGFRSAIALPLLIDKTAIGVLVLTAADAGTLSDEELQMLREIAANLSFALQYRQKDDAVRFLSHFDAQTGLAKRSLFCERMGAFGRTPTTAASVSPSPRSTSRSSASSTTRLDGTQEISCCNTSPTACVDITPKPICWRNWGAVRSPSLSM